MYEFDLSRWQNTQSLGASNVQKQKLLVFVTCLLSSIYTPLIFINYFAGHHLLSALDAMFVISLVLGSIQMYRLNTSLSPLFVFIILGLLALSATTPIAYVGVTGTFWCFPILVSSAFLLPQTTSIILNSVVILLCGLYGYDTISFGDWARFIFALIVTALLIQVFSFKIRGIQELLRHHSSTDPLTGALNRRQLDGMLFDCIDLKTQQNDQSVLAIFDLDNFKAINDKLGHAAGDKAIVELVCIIKENSRSSDLIFRYGGDEVLLLLKNTDVCIGETILNKILLAIRNSTALVTTSSIGASGITGVTPKDWINAADKALYKAKQQGKDQLVLETAAN